MEKFERKRQSNWDKRNLVTVGTHLTKTEYHALKDICTSKGKNVYRLIQDFLRAYVKANEPSIDWGMVEHHSTAKQYPPMEQQKLIIIKER